MLISSYMFFRNRLFRGLCEKVFTVPKKRNGKFLCPSVKLKSIFQNQTILKNFRPVFITIVYSVFSLYDRAAKEMTSVAAFARKRAQR